jgi:DNA-binding NtrC family response regulator
MGDRVGQQPFFPAAPLAVATLLEREALSHLVGDAPLFLAAVARLPAIARTNATVVVAGETGTGKELIARAIHYLGPRAEHPFVPVNCGALPDTLLEDELFGHERGAFTDAKTRREGLMAEAEHGTLFLDEIDSLTPRAQVALLRVLQDGRYRTLGGNRERLADVRFVAATNTSLSALVSSGRFRSDLYYRLCVLSIHVPPLRERQEDILPLARHFLTKYQQGAAPLDLSAEAGRALIAHSWPGNVRELENVIQRAIALAPAEVITGTDLGLPIGTPAPAHAALLRPVPETPGELSSVPAASDAHWPSFNEAKRAVVDSFEREYLRRLLRAHQGNVSRAARSARKERRDFGRLLKKHQLDPRAL